MGNCFSSIGSIICGTFIMLSVFRGIVSWLEHFDHTVLEFQSDINQGYFVMMNNSLYLKDNGMISLKLTAL